MLRTRVTLPPNFKERLSPERINRAVEKHLDKSYDRIKSLYAQTYSTWDHRPKFVFEKKITANSMRYKYYTEDEIYGYVHNGTGQAAGHLPGLYPIPKVPKEKGGISFWWGGQPGLHQARTKPGVIGSGDWGYGGSPVRFAGKSLPYGHPGIKPRLFTDVIYKEIEPIITKQLFAELRR